MYRRKNVLKIKIVKVSWLCIWFTNKRILVIKTYFDSPMLIKIIGNQDVGGYWKCAKALVTHQGLRKKSIHISSYCNHRYIERLDSVQYDRILH